MVHWISLSQIPSKMEKKKKIKKKNLYQQTKLSTELISYNICTSTIGVEDCKRLQVHYVHLETNA